MDVHVLVVCPNQDFTATTTTQLSPKEWDIVIRTFSSALGPSFCFVIMFVFMAMIPIFWPVLLVLLLCPPIQFHYAKKHMKNAKKLVNEKYADRGLHMKLDKRGKRSMAGIITIDNPGVPIPGVDVPTLCEEKKQVLDTMRAKYSSVPPAVPGAMPGAVPGAYYEQTPPGYYPQPYPPSQMAYA